MAMFEVQIYDVVGGMKTVVSCRVGIAACLPSFEGDALGLWGYRYPPTSSINKSPNPEGARNPVRFQTHIATAITVPLIMSQLLTGGGKRANPINGEVSYGS